MVQEVKIAAQDIEAVFGVYKDRMKSQLQLAGAISNSSFYLERNLEKRKYVKTVETELSLRTSDQLACLIINAISTDMNSEEHTPTVGASDEFKDIFSEQLSKTYSYF
uniref:Uncharacterized protein n=1 Tax=Megaselia scalaris TaxID=36166 RepID=T1GVQ6_MEGSC